MVVALAAVSKDGATGGGDDSLGSSGRFARAQGSMNWSATYDGRMNDVKSSVVARGDRLTADGWNGLRGQRTERVLQRSRTAADRAWGAGESQRCHRKQEAAAPFAVEKDVGPWGAAVEIPRWPWRAGAPEAVSVAVGEPCVRVEPRRRWTTSTRGEGARGRTSRGCYRWKEEPPPPC